MAQGAPMVRAQLLLTPKQRERLERLAQREGRKLSDVTRRALDAGLDVLEGCDEEARRRQKETLHSLRCLREELLVKYGPYPGDPVAEARQEREEQVDRLWRNE
jgi:hypothetical protein